jgi:tRNA(Ile)-lysidine synthase TilS/MesJ
LINIFIAQLAIEFDCHCLAIAHTINNYTYFTF